MLKLLARVLLGREESPQQEQDIFQTIIEKIGGDNELKHLRFIPYKAKKVEIVTTVENLPMLTEALLEAMATVVTAQYLPEKWKGKAAEPKQSRSLESFISDGNEILHPYDWVETNRHYIIKLVDAFLKMDPAEREYYLRFTTIIIEDILSMLSACEVCSR